MLLLCQATPDITKSYRQIDVRAYAEGGDFVAGLKCGLYVETFLINGDPADITAEIIDDRNISAGNIQTQHEGRGRSTFVPEAGRTYSLKVLAPSGIAKPISLPAVCPSPPPYVCLQSLIFL